MKYAENISQEYFQKTVEDVDKQLFDCLASISGLIALLDISNQNALKLAHGLLDIQSEISLLKNQLKKEIENA